MPSAHRPKRSRDAQRRNPDGLGNPNVAKILSIVWQVLLVLGCIGADFCNQRRVFQHVLNLLSTYKAESEILRFQRRTTYYKSLVRNDDLAEFLKLHFANFADATIREKLLEIFAKMLGAVEKCVHLAEIEKCCKS